MKKLAVLIVILLAGLYVFAYYFKPEDIVSVPETYALQKVVYKGEEITDSETLAQMAEAIENYKNMPRPSEAPSDLDAFVELKIIGPASEQKPTLVFGEDIYVCYWSKSVGLYEIIDGELLYKELIEILEK